MCGRFHLCATPEQIAETVLQSQGPSGPNLEYVLRLHAAMQDLGVSDPHLSAIIAALRQIRGQQTAP